MTNKLEAIKNDITNTLAQIKTLSDSITNNNLKLVHFVIDTIKILFPKSIKPNKQQIEEINQRYSWHKLGSIDSDKLQQYTDKLWSGALKNQSSHFNETANNPVPNSYKIC